VFTRLGATAAMAAWALRDAEDLSTEELLAIARAGHSRSEEAEPDVELDDEMHWLTAGVKNPPIPGCT